MKTGYYHCVFDYDLYILYPDKSVEYFFGEEWRVSAWPGYGYLPSEYFTFIGLL